MLKYLLLFPALFVSAKLSAQTKPNVVIITMDGIRWQEVFSGADTALLNKRKYVSADSAKTFDRYIKGNDEVNRKVLMPFLWSTVAAGGQIYGNRKSGNKVNVMNRYWFSYPGYNEIFTGFPDTLINSNGYTYNPNDNVLGFLNQQKDVAGKVACFGSWDAFKRILNQPKNKFPVNDGFDTTLPANASPVFRSLSKMQVLLPDIFEGEERLDAVTGLMALDYMRTQHPKVLFISLGETDAWAHESKYDLYLDAVQHNDAIIKTVWEQIQQDPFYKNNTTLLITTDHGRGISDKWTSHNSRTPNSNEIWFAVLGKNIMHKGEVKTTMQLYQQQLAQTIAFLAGYHFTGNHPVAKKVDEVFKK